MLPQKLKTRTLLIGILIFCFSSSIVTAAELRSDIWHDGPINCFSCDSVAECAESKGLLRKCENNDAQTCLTVFDQSGAVAQRGCSDIVASKYDTYCSDNADSCPSCTSSGCNDATKLDDYVECVSCDSALDSNCVLNVNAVTTKTKCHGECMTALYQSGATATPNYHLVRSCLNDRDIDDQELCLSGDAHCIGCSGANCNVQSLPETTRHSCIKCSGSDECEDPVSEECVAYNESEQCYVLLDTFGDFVKMGCRSEFDNEETIVQLIKEKSLYLCDGIDCNAFDKLPNHNDCTTCSSTDDEKCATKPTTVQSSTKCMRTLYSQCYQRVDTTSGATERGCLADLESEIFYACLIGDDENCKMCSGNICNEEIIPANRSQCQRCDSVSDSSCHSRPSALSVCPSYSADETCVAIYADGITKRGCASEFKCDADARNCQLCKGDGCNKENLKKRVEEAYGIFQDLPLNCNTCSGADCLTGVRNPRKCEGDIYQDCVTVFSDDGVVVRRGCENTLEASFITHCETHPELCFNCKSNGCNTINDVSAFTECLYCDSASNVDCLLAPASVTSRRKCAEGCIATLYERSGYDQVYDLVRACYEDIESDDRTKCDDNKDCIKCSDADCNNAVIPELRLTCNHCDNDATCAKPVSQLCAGYAANDQCYVQVNNATNVISAMGCKSDITAAQLLDNVKNLVLCDGDNCNTAALLSTAATRCVQCNSADDVNCATQPLLISSSVSCTVLSNTQCYARLQSDGNTERGCLYNLSTDEFIGCQSTSDANCLVCNGDNCNNVVHPADRPTCHRCNSLLDDKCASTPNSPQPCPIFHESQQCVSRIEGGVTQRACAGELSCAGLGRNECRVCDGNNCNTLDLASAAIGDVGLFQDLPLNCYHCNNTRECADGTNGIIRKCEGNTRQMCSVAFDTNGQVAARGCSDLLDEICTSPDNDCYDCKSNGCNVATEVSDYIDCVFCDARENDACTFDAASITHTRKCYKSCATALFARTKDAQPVFELTRTCLDDLDLDERNACAAGNSVDCKACSTPNCNRDLVGVRKSCYQCEGDDCQAPVAKTCRAYAPDDQCYIQYDETNQVVKMGCQSEYDAPELNTLLKAKRVWLCADENCNTFDNLPASQRCILCNSLSDPMCAYMPGAVFTDTACSKLPYTECYSRILDNGHTERGCLNSLAGDDFVNCLNNVNSTACVKCSGDNCNGSFQPEERRSCQVCSSATSDDCDSWPQSEQVCLKYAADQECVTKLTANGDTVRGCSNEVSCVDGDTIKCLKCEGDNCNTSNIKRKSDGKPGLWQTLPLTCRSCSSKIECSSSNSAVCTTESEYCMTVFDDAGDVIRRGCSDAVEAQFESYCDGSSTKCHNCNSNECNIASNLEDYVDCVYCDSTNNADCVFNVAAVKNRRKCNKSCMTALYPRTNGSTVFELTRSCLDDMDLEGQTKCTAGNNENCKACTGAACNVDQLPEERLSCWSCAGGECEEDAKTQECKSYSVNDECYILFDEQSDVRQMGCLSDLSTEFVADNNHLLLTCYGSENCNGFESIPTAKLCAVCNSEDDPTCASDPAHIPTMQTCSALPNTECYTRVNTADGSTRRGCVSSLPKTEMLSCLSASDEKCFVCQGDRCNMEVFPPERRTCHRCNTKEDPTCESTTTVSAASVCPVYSTQEFCTTKLVNGHTYRGCSSDFQCSDSDKYYCRQCSGLDNCNVVDLAKSNIGYPGQWQSAPINCYTCLGPNCDIEGAGQIRKCEGFALQTCGTVFDSAGIVIQRGCSDQIYAGENSLYCDVNSDKCKFCKSNGCNIAKSLTDFQDCIYCDGADNADCVLNVASVSRTRSCNKQCVTGLVARNDSDSNPIYDLVRGCLDDLDLDDRTACAAGEKAYCKACTGINCNTETIPEKRLKCNVCEGADCEEPQSHSCIGFRENDQCFTLYESDSDVTRMGCASDLDSEFIKENKRRLLLCNDDNCNDVVPPAPVACKICNSLLEPNCAVKPSVGQVATVCQQLPHTSCITHVDEAGVTHRGCLSDVSDELFDKCTSGESDACTICNSNNCNTEIYPLNRRSCNRCNSATNPTCSDNPESFAQVCPIFEQDDSCVSVVDGGHILRGCASEFTCDPSQRDICRICADKDNCNTIDLLANYIGVPGKWQALPINCYECDGEECASGKGKLHKCENNNEQTCMTVFGTDGAVIRRGCSDAVKAEQQNYCDDNAEKCMACKSSGCNTATTLSQYTDCYFCDGADNNECAINFDVAKGKTRKCLNGCMVALYPRTDVTDPAYELTRTCLDDKDLDDQEACVAGEDALCQSCEGARCNTGKLPAERHECYSCVGEACEDATSQQCSAYHPNDECYTLYDAGSITRMGCRSEFEMDIVTELIKQKQLRLCAGKNCNAPSALDTPKTCAVCNSADDVRCATQPNLVGKTERCLGLPYSECYKLITAEGHTERGCLAALESETFYSCLLGNGTNCEVCTGDKCNDIDVYPDDRVRCQQCSSSSDANCAKTPNSNAVCALYDAKDSCVTNFNNGITTRGCASSLKCDNPADTRTCRVCTGSGCNTVNLEKIGEQGSPGLWQDVPLTCYTCVGADCLESLGSFRSCQNNPWQQCMTVFDVEGVVVQRGCSDTVEAAHQAHCDSNDEKCPRCNSNGCNNAKSLDEYVECLFCDSDVDGNCVRNVNAVTNTRLCNKQCMTALYERDAENQPAYGLSRSCLDDKDLDEREACAAGTDQNCVACTGAKCNTIALPAAPARRISCNHCVGDDCQDPQAQTCVNYREDDKCYIQYDERRQIVAMGCRSEFSNSEADYLLKEKRLFLCADADNCNTFDALPVAQTCTLCNSRTDPQCAQSPDQVTSTTNCNFIPFTDCYTRVLDDGATERGCHSSLYDDSFMGCLNGTSSSCKTCSGNACNSEIFPKERSLCHICDSSIDTNCEATPNSLNICPKYAPDDMCVTTYRNDVTYRGCASSLSCDSTNPRNCVKCSGNGCNNVNLAQKQDDNYGKWQDLPLRCLSCIGDECKATSEIENVTCALNNEQDCVTRFDATGNVVERGCSDIVEANCDANGANCVKCKSNECNTADSLANFVDCIYCDSYKDKNCLWNPLSEELKSRKCDGGCMTALYAADGSIEPTYELIRTCLNDKEAKDQASCSLENDPHCKACTGSKCNVDVLPAERFTCFICQGDDCEEPVSQQCPLHKENDQCYIWFDEKNSISEMGCVSSFRNQNIENIIKTKRVFVCDGKDCNTADNLPAPQKCAVCDSNNDVFCAIDAYSVGTIQSCSALPYRGCYNKLASDGSTVRGCLADLPGEEFASCLLGNDKNCEYCEGDGCNREVYPNDRLQCIKCTSEDDENCESFGTKTMACERVTDTESCTSALSGNVTVRGCSSEVYCDAADRKTCRSCSRTGCNAIDLRNKEYDDNHGLWQTLPLRCHTCEGEHCLNSLGPALTCTGNDEQDCMTVFNAEGVVIQRGCSDDVENYRDAYCRLNPELCYTCKSNECNMAWERNEYTTCAYCNSVDDPLCAINPENAGFKQRACRDECMVALKNSTVVRSCLDDKESMHQHVCRDGAQGDECASCQGNTCNKFVFPADRLRCHVCTGSTCSASTVQYCAAYDKNDYCFAKFEGGKADLLGCASAQNASDIADWTAQQRLFTCEGNECNALNKLPSSGVCITCDSSKSPECAQNPSLITTTEVCSAPRGECVTRINEAGHTLRGCANKLTIGEESFCVGAGTCVICTDSRCNAEIFPTNRRTCLICNSVADSKCTSEPSTALTCPIYKPNDKCISRKTDDFVERGCMSQLQCEDNNSSCEYCDGDNCNNKDLRGGASIAASSMALTLLLAFVAFFGLSN